MKRLPALLFAIAVLLLLTASLTLAKPFRPPFPIWPTPRPTVVPIYTATPRVCLPPPGCDPNTQICIAVCSR